MLTPCHFFWQAVLPTIVLIVKNLLNFSVIQILREIKVGDSRVFNTILGAPNFDSHEFLHFYWVENRNLPTTSTKFRDPKIVTIRAILNIQETQNCFHVKSA